MEHEHRARVTVREGIRRRVRRAREQRANGRGIWAALRGLFAGIEDQATDQAADRIRELEAVCQRDNRLFDADGPGDRDLLPGGRYERRTGRRPSAFWWPR